MPKRAISPNFAYLTKSLDEGKRGAILEGSSRSTKTWGGIDFLMFLCTKIEKRATIIIVRETYTSFKTTLYNDFNRRLPDYGISSPFIEKRDVDAFWLFGNKITLMGCDRPDKFEGATNDYFWMNEMLDQPRVVFDQLEQRNQKFWWGDYNPKYHDHWVYDNICKRDDVGFLHTTYLDNPFVSPGEKAKILGYEPTPYNIEQGTADEFRWRVYGLGLRGSHKTGSEFYYNFVYTRHVKDVEFIPGYPIHLSNDQNVVPYISGLVGQIIEDENGVYNVNLIDEICLENPRNNTEEVCKELTRRHDLGNGFYYYGDATGRNRDTRANENDYDILERVLNKYISQGSCRVPFSNPMVKRRREFINDIFVNKYPIRVNINPRCKNLIKDLERLQEDPEGKKFKKKVSQAGMPSYEELGHLADCLDYLVMSAFENYIQ